MNGLNTSLIDYIKAIIEEHTYCKWDEAEQSFTYELYADYRDSVDEKTVSKWCKCEEPRSAFWEDLFQWYECSTFDCEDEVMQAIRDHWQSDAFSWDDCEEDILSWVREHICFRYPEDHYLKQKVCVNIIVDTGDANYDYVLNDVYPHYNARIEDTVHEEASLLWLIRQQGYKKRQLNKALRDQEYSGSKLLKSVRTEVLNCNSHMNALVFFVEMTIEQLLNLQEAIRDNGKNDPPIGKDSYRCVWERKGRRKIILDKSAVCGLYDTWNGSGSILEIELEKDVVLPMRYIDTAWPDGGRGSSVANVYGVCSSMWTPTLKKIA